MLIGKQNAIYGHSYARILSVALLIACTLFLVFALFSYHPNDVSWFYFSTKNVTTQNWGGLIGAYVSALLFFLFGSASVLCIPIISYVIYNLVIYNSMRNEIERVVSFCLLMPFTAAIFNFYCIDFLNSSYPGGFIGGYFIFLLGAIFDSFVTQVFLYSFTSILLILIFQFSFIGAVHTWVATMAKVHMFLKKHNVYAYVYYCIQNFLWFTTRPCVYTWRFLRELCDGTAFEYARLDIEQDHEDWLLDENLFNQSEQTIEEQILFLEQSMVQNNQQQIHKITTAKKAIPARVTQEKEREYNHDVQQSIIENELDQTYQLPNLNIFIGVESERDDKALRSELEQRAKTLEEKLERFGITGTVSAIKRGPVVTLFEYLPQIDTKLSKILALEDDLAMALQALSIRILAPIPGRSVVGFEVANNNRLDVLFAHIVQSKEFKNFSGALPLVLGQDTIGNEIIVDLARMPHLLIAGSTGSGKSVALNAMLVSLLCACKPQDLKLILIDPKRLEFVSYADIAHLLFPIVANPKQAPPVLRWVVKQMEERYELMAASNTRNIFDYNKYIEHTKRGERLPFIVVVIDELADLMMTTGREIEDLITRIAQMARAAGIHMIVATQRPSVDVITGLIKVNFPSRISFRVTSRIDSRTILDCGGADKLLGRGDMLFLDSNSASMNRVHGAYVSDDQIEQVVNHIKAEQTVEYLDLKQEIMNDMSDLSSDDDELYQEVLSFLDEIDEVSISLVQRKFRIGYNRSARIIDTLESNGHILCADGSKTRKVVK